MSVQKYPSEKCSNLGKYTIKMATPFHIESDVGGKFRGGKNKMGRFWSSYLAEHQR